MFILLFILPFEFVAQSDTLNQKDSLGRKQGHWVFYGKDQPQKGYPAEGKISEGDYLNDRKNGEWIMYYKDGVTPKIKGTFINNRPTGSYQTYNRDGILKEKGTFENMRNSGKTTSYWPNGNLREILFYNEHGKLHGDLKFYYETGELEAEITFINGVMTDTVKRYYSDGGLKELAIFDSTGAKIDSFIKPQIIQDSTGNELYRIVEPNNASRVPRQPISKPIVPCPQQQESKIYNEDKYLLYEGYFKNCRLWDGRHYIYDDDGLLLKVKVYKEGKYHSDGQL